jgi:hypothetical protein
MATILSTDKLFRNLYPVVRLHGGNPAVSSDPHAIKRRKII